MILIPLYLVIMKFCPCSSHKRLGNSLVAYLYRKNYSALALNLVQNTKARFSLALDSGNLEVRGVLLDISINFCIIKQVAFKTCYELKDRDCYAQLGEEALRQGNQQVDSSMLLVIYSDYVDSLSK